MSLQMTLSLAGPIVLTAKSAQNAKEKECRVIARRDLSDEALSHFGTPKPGSLREMVIINWTNIV